MYTMLIVFLVIGGQNSKGTSTELTTSVSFKTIGQYSSREECYIQTHRLGQLETEPFLTVKTACIKEK